MNTKLLQNLIDTSIISFTLTDGTVVAGETASNIRHELVSVYKVGKLPAIGTKFGLLLSELGMTKGRGKREGFGKVLDIYFYKERPDV